MNWPARGTFHWIHVRIELYLPTVYFVRNVKDTRNTGIGMQSEWGRIEMGITNFNEEPSITK